MNKWLNKKVRRLQWFDISLIKSSTMFFTLMLAKLSSSLLSWDWEVYLVLSIVFAIRPFYQFYLCKE